MELRQIASRAFNQDVGKAKKAALCNPVFITDRGKPSHVLLSIKQYEALTERSTKMPELLAMPQADTIDFEPENLKGPFIKPEDFD